MTEYLKLYDYAMKAIRVYRNEKNHRSVGVRRLHYWIVSIDESGRITLRMRTVNGKRVWNPEPYQNNKTWYDALIGVFTDARLKGDIPFDWIIDEKNPDPIWMPGRSEIEFNYTYSMGADLGSLPRIDYSPMPEWNKFIDNISIDASVTGGKFISQKYRIAVFIEKATNADAMEELCRYHGADLFIFSGQASTTRTIEYALAAKAENKPCCLLYINDADPGGMYMGDAVFNKIMAVYPREDHIWERVALTPDQIRKYDLPVSFDIESKKYENGTIERFNEEYEGLSPRELDALDEDIILDEVDKALSKYSNLDEDKQAIRAAKETAFYDLDYLRDNTFQSLERLHPDYENLRSEFNRLTDEIDSMIQPHKKRIVDIQHKQMEILMEIKSTIEGQGISGWAYS